MDNPKLVGTNIIDCIPQSGVCPNHCNQCFYNHAGFFTNKIPLIPTKEDAMGKIVRMNTGHDSNIQKNLVLETASQYKDVFFNTSMPNLDFPNPVVLTVNKKENEDCISPRYLENLQNLMFVRFRVSATNLVKVFEGTHLWHLFNIPTVLTFMRYYSEPPFILGGERDEYWHYMLDMPENLPIYEYKKHLTNEYWCPSEYFINHVMDCCKNSPMIHFCGTATSSYCKDCGVCEHFYWLTKKRLRI